jgi:hypothetical protein
MCLVLTKEVKEEEGVALVVREYGFDVFKEDLSGGFDGPLEFDLAIDLGPE